MRKGRAARRVWLLFVGSVMVSLAVLAPAPVQAQQCAAGACVSAGPRLASVDSKQSALLNPLLQVLLPGTSINLSLLDWDSLAGADIDLNLLLTRLAADLDVSEPSQVLDTDIGLGPLLLASATVLQADGQTAAASVLQALGLQLGGLTGTIRLAELFQLDFPPGALSDVRLDVLDLLTGWVQLYNFRNVVTTPQPIAINSAALGLEGVTDIELWLQVVEPPVYACGPEGTQFHSAAVRAKLNVLLLNTASLQGLVSVLSGLNILELARLTNVALDATALHLQLYADIARAEGTIGLVDAIQGTVALQARPGLVNLYLGEIADALFWNRGSVLTPDVVAPIALTTLQLKANICALLCILPLAGVEGEIGVNVRAWATGTPGLQTQVVGGPFPATITMAAGTVSLSTLVQTLLSSLEVSASGMGLRLTTGNLPVGLDLAGILNLVVATLNPVIKDVLSPLIGQVLDLLLGDILDALLSLLGIQVGQATFTVEGVAQACAAELVLAKALDPASDGGRFDLSILRGGAPVAAASGVGHEGATSPVLTEPGARYQLLETGAAGTSLAAYAASWACSDDNDVVVASGQGTEFEIDAPALGPQPATITCRFTNRLRQSSVSVTKSDGSAVYVPGTETVYIIVVGNEGPDAATGITVQDTLPPGATLSAPWECSAVSGTCSSGSGGGVGGTQVQVDVDIDVGGQATIRVPVRFSADPADYQ